MAKKADNTVMKMREELLKKKAALLGSEKPVYVAGDYFRPSKSVQRGEFQVNIASADQLLEGVKSLFVHEKSAEVLGMPTDHLGFPVAEWITDFQTRKSVLDRTVNLRKVKVLEDKLRPLLTAAQLREIGIGDLLSEIADL